ncbi:hypothetical protein [Hymenobacter sp. YC55]|uniref:hypothetical protein n=1 Tax=Hymenobacter sp. YC55 TaxID=3034019 RepID=UPI0023FA1FE9|nr:hypothetical protein [Hymenobacter sp. YC55]MDF7815733.1 hypothetical protein [Hymenobacter sp. YC55]
MERSTSKIGRRDFLKQLSLTSIAFLPAVQTLGELVDGDSTPLQPGETGEFFIDAAYRLMHYRNMLELEFYFLNVERDEVAGLLLPFKGKNAHYRAYMVIRLPQQHVAEEYADAIELQGKCDMLDQLKQSRIAGYSYLCFAIDFTSLPGRALPIKASDFMAWNAKHFSLISKPDNNIRPFVYDLDPAQDIPENGSEDYIAPDIYPLSYSGKKYHRKHYPNQRNYPEGLRSNRRSETIEVRDQAPFTALEIPYRLILSPRLPSWEYDYSWIFTSCVGHLTSPAEDPNTGLEAQSEGVELWMATLTLTKKKGAERNAANKKKSPSRDKSIDSVGEAPQGTYEMVNQAENHLQLMILGPSGAEQFRTGQVEADPTAPAKIRPKLLPTEKDRLDLVRLSSLYNLPATAPSLTFTPMGVCTQIAFRNKYFEKNGISLYQWKQAISFGRDQEVEVSNVVVDATFGLKMLHVRTTRRETTRGHAPLIYREFLLPLEPEKDFASYAKHDASEYSTLNFKYATPFQHVRFADLNARQILPVQKLLGDLCVRIQATEQNKIPTKADLKNVLDHHVLVQAEVDDKILKQSSLNPECPEPPTSDLPPAVAFWAVTPDKRLLEWPMEFTDWSGRKKTLKRKLYLLRSDLNLEVTTEKAPVYPYSLAAGPIDTEALVRELADKRGFDLTINKLKDTIAAKAGPAAGDTWTAIRLKAEEFSLQTVDAARVSLQRQLNRLEEQLVAISTAGQRDVEDLVMEEWNLFKRRVLTPAATLEGELQLVLAQAKRLGTLAQVIQHDLERDIVKLQQDIERRTDPKLIIRDTKVVLKRRIDALLALKGVDAILTNVIDFKEELIRRRDAIQQQGETLIGFAYEKANLIKRLPKVIGEQVKRDLNLELDNVNAYQHYIQEVEGDLRSRIPAVKAEICYAVHQAEDELETLKRALDAKFGSRASQAWQQAFEEFSRDFAHAATGHIATMRTDFLVFRSNLLFAEKTIGEVQYKVFDFFNSYPCFPQLHTAQVYAEAVNDLARREIPLKIKYAADYVANQVDNVSLEVKNNAARVFAEVHGEAQEFLKGAMREAGKDLGGLVNPELAAQYLTLLKDGSAKAKETLEDLRATGDELAAELQVARGQILATANKDLNKLLQEQYAKSGMAQHLREFDRMRNGMLTLAEQAKRELKAAEQDVKVQAAAFFQGLEAKILGSIRLRDLLGPNFNLPKLTRLPDKVTYEFLTQDFKPLDVKVFRFIPKPTTSLSAYLAITTKSPQDLQSNTRLSNFTLGIFGDRLLVEFQYIELKSTRKGKNQTNVALGKIGFGKELEFLATLAQGFKLPGTGLKIEPSLSDISITYALPIPGMSGGAFTFDNLKFNIGVSIPIPTGLETTNQPLGIKLGINSATDPFAIGVLIFGGMGHFNIETTPRYIRRIDAGLSFGGLFRINLGIAVGQAYLQAGIRYQYQRLETGEANMELHAIITCGANVTVFGFIDVSVVFVMALKYRKDSGGSALYGVASVSYSVRIGFFRKSFTLTFSKRIAGADAPARPMTAPARTAPRVARQEALRGMDAPQTPVYTLPPAERRRLEKLESQREQAAKSIEEQQAQLDRIERELYQVRESGATSNSERERGDARTRQQDALDDRAAAAANMQGLYDAYCFEPIYC